MCIRDLVLNGELELGFLANHKSICNAKNTSTHHPPTELESAMQEACSCMFGGHGKKLGFMGSMKLACGMWRFRGLRRTTAFRGGAGAQYVE